MKLTKRQAEAWEWIQGESCAFVKDTPFSPSVWEALVRKGLVYRPCPASGMPWAAVALTSI